MRLSIASRHLVLLTALACAPVLDDTTPYVSSPRVLAVRVDPPEAIAGTDVQLTALYADETGALTEAPLDWAFCTVPKPLAELGPVSSSCLDPASEHLAAVGSGIQVTGTVPADACSLFGPNPPPPVDGSPGGRPADPDVTGGFYQPALGFLSGDVGGGATLVPVRVRCGLANVSQETYIAWNTGYRSNENPAFESVSLGIGSAEPVIVSEGTVPAVKAGDTVTLKVAWPACPETGVCGDGVCSADEDATACASDCTTPRGCHGAETYVVYDPATSTMISRREGLSATWFATGGTFDEARNGREGSDPATDLANGWTAPDTDGEVWLAVALRDERGGVQFTSFRVHVAR